MQDTEDSDLRELRTDLEQIVADGTRIWQRQQAARAVRFCEWDGQSEDGRKHEDALGELPVPFEGASDARVPLVDSIVQDKKVLARTAFFRAQVQTEPVEPDDGPRSTASTTLLRYLRDRAMREELETEIELSAEHMFADDPGLAIVEVCWLQDTMLARRQLTFDELGVLYATGATNPDEINPADPRLEPELLQDFIDLATNPAREREMLDWLASVYPLLSAKVLRRALRELRRAGATELPVPVVRENRPSVQALRYLEDVFFPIGTADIQRARHIHRREWVSESDLRERAFVHGWNADAVEDIIEKGQGESVVSGTLTSTGVRSGQAFSGPGLDVNEQDNLFEIWWSYERRGDELGVPGIYRTVWSGAADRPLKQELMPNAHGRYPFVARPRERTTRQLTESRGLTRPIATHQQEVKVQRDARSNYTQLTASPPYKVAMQRGAFDLIVAPNAEIPVQRMDDWDWAPPPSQLPQASIEMERTTKLEVDEYAGRMAPGLDPNRVALMQQHDVDNFLALWRGVFSLVLADCQQFFSPAELQRITGVEPALLEVRPEDIRGGFDIFITIDARDLNMEYALKKLDAYGKIIGYDSNGQLDRGPVIEVVAASIDPVLARRTLRPAQNVTQREIDSTKNAVAQMAAGIEPDMPVSGINPQLRAQTLQQTVRGSQKLSQQYMQDPGFQELVNNYQKYLMQQMVQEQNKLTGRLGVSPTQDGLQSASLAPPSAA